MEEIGVCWRCRRVDTCSRKIGIDGPSLIAAGNASRRTLEASLRV